MGRARLPNSCKDYWQSAACTTTSAMHWARSETVVPRPLIFRSAFVSSPSRRASENPRRHDLAFVSPTAWRSFVETRDDLAEDPLVAGWVDRGWPLIARRSAPEEGHGVPLGLPLPPSAGKRRIGLLMDPVGIRSTARPPLLSAAFRVSPAAWVPSSGALNQMSHHLVWESRGV